MTISFKKIQKIKRNILCDLNEKISKYLSNALLHQLLSLDETEHESPDQERLVCIRKKDAVDSYVSAAKIVAKAIKEIGGEYGI